MKLIQQLNTHTWFTVPDNTEESLYHALISLLSRNSCSQEELNLLLDLTDPNHELESTSTEEIYKEIINKLESQNIIHHLIPTSYQNLFISSKPNDSKLENFIDFEFFSLEGNERQDYYYLINDLGMTLEVDEMYLEDLSDYDLDRAATDTLILEGGVEFFMYDAEYEQWLQITHGFSTYWIGELGLLLEKTDISKDPIADHEIQDIIPYPRNPERCHHLVSWLHPGMKPDLNIYYSLYTAKNDILDILREKEILSPIDSVPENAPLPEPAEKPLVITKEFTSDSQENSSKETSEPLPEYAEIDDLPF